MYNILTLNKIAGIGTDLFDKSKYTYGTDIQNPDGVLVRSASMHDFEFGKVIAVARAGAGVNNIPLDKCTEKGIVVFNTPGANSNAVKELTIAALFMISRNIPSAIEWAKTALKGKGGEVASLVEKGKGQFVGREIYGKRLGIIGLGAIGVAVANAAVSLGMDVIGYDPYLSVDGALNLARSVHYVKNVKELYENCDYITLHLPSTSETRGSINAEAIGSMKKDVCLLNFARGDLVDENAVLDALNKGGMKGYITDFPSDDLIGAPGVVAIPHLGASTPESEDNCAVMAVNEMIDYFENGNITNSVNLPSLALPRTGDARICVIHRNVQGLLSRVTTAFADANCNIESIDSRSRGEVAYTIMDVVGDYNAGYAKIQNGEHVIYTRIIVK
jgi:D-3-phosphoglycerate dehydrogenase